MKKNGFVSRIILPKQTCRLMAAPPYMKVNCCAPLALSQLPSKIFHSKLKKKFQRFLTAELLFLADFLFDFFCLHDTFGQLLHFIQKAFCLSIKSIVVGRIVQFSFQFIQYFF